MYLREYNTYIIKIHYINFYFAIYIKEILLQVKVGSASVRAIVMLSIIKCRVKYLKAPISHNYFLNN